MTWASIHAFYHGDLDVLLLDGVRPLVDDLRGAGLVDGFFFLRYWDGGPHLRIRLSVPDGHDVESVALLRLRAYLRNWPSTDLPDTARYPEAAARRAADEGITGYLRAPMPNNSALAIPYRPEHDRYGDGEALATVERHFVESSRIALGLIAAGLTRDQRITAAFVATALTWHGRPRTAPPHDDEHEARYARMRDRLRHLAGQAARVADGTSDLSAHGAFAAWWQTIGTLPDRRVADLCTHLFCNRLGIGPAEERYVRYLTARTLSDRRVPA